MCLNLKTYYKAIISLLLFLINSFLFSHIHWIDIDNYYPKKKDTIKIAICSGHNFPKSSFTLSKRLISESFFLEQNKKKPIFLKGEKNKWCSEYTVNKEGVFYIGFILKKKQLKEAFFFGRGIIFVNDNNFREYIPYSTGDGLEIVLQSSLLNLKKGEKIAFKILYKGNPVRSSSKIISEKGGVSFLNSDREGIIQVKIKKTGKYLITANYKKKGSSLSFSIPNLKK